MTNEITIGKIKRCLERWSADPTFRNLLHRDPGKAIERYNLELNPLEIRLLWDKDYAAQSNPATTPPPVKRYRDFINTKLAHRDHLRTHSSSSDFRINKWRQRQMMRCHSQFGPEKHATIVHAPFAVELSKGCSVGCWFCGYSAPKLSALYHYTEENKVLWQQTLTTLREVWGDNAKYGFCYWATEPLDNPDYEKFLGDFREILGYFPQTTTATPLRDIARTKKLIELSRRHNGFVERFSIHTLEKLEEVFNNFSADELEMVELITQNEESNLGFANSGKILEEEDPRKDTVVISDSTIACVSGFLLNMIDKSVQLVSPCVSSSRWPKGYIIYDEKTFADGSSLKTALNNMIDNHMPTTLGRNKKAGFRTDLRIKTELNGFTLHNTHNNHSSVPPITVLNSSKQILHPKLSELGKLVAEGVWSAGELAGHFEGKDYILPADTFHCLNTLFSYGCLEESPQ